MVVFDMAGTTVDENNLVYKTLLKAINDKGFNFNLEDVLEVGAGKEKQQAIAAVLATAGIHDYPLTKAIYDQFQIELAETYSTQQISSQPKAREVFSELRSKGIKITLDTGYDRTTASQILQKLGWAQGQEYDLLVTASDVSRNRPFPDMIEHAMEHFAIKDPSSVIKVGDSAIDVEEGQNADCGLSIGITTGAHTPEQLKMAKPDYIIDSLEELLPLI